MNRVTLSEGYKIDILASGLGFVIIGVLIFLIFANKILVFHKRRQFVPNIIYTSVFNC